MRSRPARLTLSALAWTCLGAAAFLTFHFQQQIDGRRASLRMFEATGRDVIDALGDAQAGQQAYVAPGQDAREWGGKVAAHLQTAATSIDTLRTTAQSTAAGPALLDASAALTQIRGLDGRLHQRLANDLVSEASALVFSESAAAFSTAVSDVDTALGAERQADELFEVSQQRLQLYALAGAGGFAALILAVLAFAKPSRRDSAVIENETSVDEAAGLSVEDVPAAGSLSYEDRPDVQPLEAAPSLSIDGSVEALRRAADVCAGFGTVRDASDLASLLEQSADALNARGLIVWLGSTAGADLRPVLAHGYTEATLARIPGVARDADNAAASAYRTGAMQVVKSRAGGSQGAVVAPLIGPDGCIGALTAEIRDRQEESDTTRALARIVASQLAAVLAQAAAPREDAGQPEQASAVGDASQAV